MSDPRLGILTGISYVSGLDYFRGINEKVTSARAVMHVMRPNPEIVMVSLDCDRYVHLLSTRQFEAVEEYLLEGIATLAGAGCDLVAIASNTGHICAPRVAAAYPALPLIHIADCCALEARRAGHTHIGLVGTQPTMEEDYLLDRLRQHGLEVIVPADSAVRQKMYDIICQELSFDDVRDESREFFVNAIRSLADDGAGACLLGCTEIELLVRQADIPGVPLIPSAETHIGTLADILLGRLESSDLSPPANISGS